MISPCIGRRWLVALLGLLVLAQVPLIVQMLRPGLAVEQAQDLPIEGQRDTKLVWEFFGKTPGADVFDRSQPLVQALVRYSLVNNQAQLLTDIGLAYQQDGRQQDQAEQFLDEAIVKSEQLGIVPTCPHHGLGTIFFQRGDRATALQHWETFIANSERTGIEDDNTRLIRWSLSVVLYLEGRDERSLLYLRSYIPLARNDGQRCLAWALLSALELRQTFGFGG